ncbi:MAG: DUF488 domain-containing protein [Candidatus Bipolaricaulia bacterium]
MIRTKRAYDPIESEDGARVLVDRMWPRGVKKSELGIDAWHKDVAPSKELRQWFAHDPDKWDEFQRRYFAELDDKPDVWRSLLEFAREGDLTLVYGARDREHNNAVALKAYLEAQRRPAPSFR